MRELVRMTIREQALSLCFWPLSMIYWTSACDASVSISAAGNLVMTETISPGS